MKIAIIGSGIAGLTAAYRLHTSHDVTLFEAGEYLGGHTRTVDVTLGGERHAIDTGFIVFNATTYPRFSALLDELGVSSRPTSMSFSVRSDRTGLEYCGSSLSGLFCQKRNLLRPRFYQMLRDILRFNREAKDCLRQSGDPTSSVHGTVREFLSRGRYSREFAAYYLLPMGSAIWSCPVEAFAEFPIRFMLEFFHNHGLLDLRDRPEWRVVEQGSRSYVRAMARIFGKRVRIRLRAPVQTVRRNRDFVELKCRNGEAERFDHVVFACHADQALRTLADPTACERDSLCAFRYERNTALLHTDATVMPKDRRAWASWNYRIPRHDSPRATLTYCMNILQGLRSRHVFNVTLNGEETVDPAKVIDRFVFEHPVFTTRRDAAQAGHSKLLNSNRSSYCGAYWGNGFHEDGVVSALAVCQALQTAEPPSTRRSERVGVMPPPPPPPTIDDATTARTAEMAS